MTGYKSVRLGKNSPLEITANVSRIKQRSVSLVRDREEHVNREQLDTDAVPIRMKLINFFISLELDRMMNLSLFWFLIFY